MDITRPMNGGMTSHEHMVNEVGFAVMLRSLEYYLVMNGLPKRLGIRFQQNWAFDIIN